VSPEGLIGHISSDRRSLPRSYAYKYCFSKIVTFVIIFIDAPTFSEEVKKVTLGFVLFPSGHMQSDSKTLQIDFCIIGGGIGGLASALGLHRSKIGTFRIFERDASMTVRPQGYSITIQQGLEIR
jgi:hypothetical protein